MLAIRVIALVLIVVSAAGLAMFSGFDEVRTAEMASGHSDIAMWIGAGGMLLGGLMLVGLATRR